tara:strand:+ start:303 stop:506 length:204 start_codon:yes stop_codon:yes gene_type:complete
MPTMDKLMRTWLKQQMKLIDDGELCPEKAELILEQLARIKANPVLAKELTEIINEIEYEKLHGTPVD